MRKKYVFLFLITALGILATILAPEMVLSSAPLVRSTAVSGKNIEITMFCTGKIEAGRTQNVLLDTPVIIDQVMVKKGDTVKKGDLLFTVNRDKTLLYLSGFAAMDLSKTISEDGVLEYGGNVVRIPREVFAETDGIVNSVTIKNNATVEGSTTLMTIAEGTGLIIRANISETQIKSVKVGQKARITGAGFESEFEGTVQSISENAEQVIGSGGSETAVQTEISIDSPNKELKVGFTAKVRIIIDSSTDVLVLPYEAILQDKNNVEYVYVIRQNRAFRSDIVTNRDVDEGVEILSGVLSGDEVVTNPQEIAKDGSLIRIESSG